jgi:hypothetical protein
MSDRALGFSFVSSLYDVGEAASHAPRVAGISLLMSIMKKSRDGARQRTSLIEMTEI